MRCFWCLVAICAKHLRRRGQWWDGIYMWTRRDSQTHYFWTKKIMHSRNPFRRRDTKLSGVVECVCVCCVSVCNDKIARRDDRQQDWWMGWMDGWTTDGHQSGVQYPVCYVSLSIENIRWIWNLLYYITCKNSKLQFTGGNQVLHPAWLKCNS